MSNGFQSAAIQRMVSRSSSEALDRSKLLGKLKAMHISTSEEDQLRDHLEMIAAHLTSGVHDEGYAIAVSGKSGAGKSTLVRETLQSMEVFEPFEDEYGNTMHIYLRVRTPPACSMKALGRQILIAAGYPLTDKKMPETEIWNLVASTLRRKNCHILVFDEFQHALKATQNKGLTHITDTMKSLMQDDTWPLYLILVGVPQMLEFIELDGDRQASRRTRVLHLNDIEDTEESLQQTVQTLSLLTESCQLRVAFPVRRGFVRRLMHGGLWRHGMIIQLIKMSIECALLDKNAKGTIAMDHFVNGYQNLSDCDPDSNVFVAEDWQSIDREVTDDGKLTATYTRIPNREAVA